MNGSVISEGVSARSWSRRKGPLQDQLQPHLQVKTPKMGKVLLKQHKALVPLLSAPCKLSLEIMCRFRKGKLK